MDKTDHFVTLCTGQAPIICSSSVNVCNKMLQIFDNIAVHNVIHSASSAVVEASVSHLHKKADKEGSLFWGRTWNLWK